MGWERGATEHKLQHTQTHKAQIGVNNTKL